MIYFNSQLVYAGLSPAPPPAIVSKGKPAAVGATVSTVAEAAGALEAVATAFRAAAATAALHRELARQPRLQLGCLTLQSGRARREMLQPQRGRSCSR